MVLEEGKIAEIILLSSIILINLWWASKVKVSLPTLRKIPAIDAISEAVNRSAEMGKAVMFCPGVYEMIGREGPQLVAGLSILSYVAQLCAESGTRLIAYVATPEVIPLAKESVRAGYTMAGKETEYNEEIVRYSPGYEAWAIGIEYMEKLHTENVGASLMIGPFWSISLMMLEEAYAAGVYQVGGTATYYQIPFFVSSCDYSLMGEEVYAASTYLDKNPEMLGTIAASDFSKFLIMGLIILGSLFITVGFPLISDLLSM